MERLENRNFEHIEDFFDFFVYSFYGNVNKSKLTE